MPSPTPLATKAAALIAALGKATTSDDVFGTFEELDALPPDVVRAALEPVTGTVRDPSLLEERIRETHGFAPPPLVLGRRPWRVLANAARLSEIEQAQIRAAGLRWDGAERPAADRLGEGDASLGKVEITTLLHASGKPAFDVLRHDGDNGLVFRAGTAERVADLADGTVETKDARLRAAIANALASAEAVAEAPAPAEAGAEAEAEAEAGAEAEAEAGAGAEAEAPTPKKRAAPKKAAAAAPKKTAAKKKTAAPKKTAAKKKTAAPKKTTAKKKTATAAKKKTAAPKKTTAKKKASAKR